MFLQELVSASEPVKSSPLSFQSINDIKSSDSLSFGVFSVSDRITNDIFQEGSQYEPGLVIHKRADSFDSASSSESPNRWLGDAHDDFFDLFGLMTLSSADASLLASFSAMSWCHVVVFGCESFDKVLIIDY